MKHKIRTFKSRANYINSLRFLHQKMTERIQYLEALKIIGSIDTIDLKSLKDSTLSYKENIANIDKLIHAHIRT